MGLLVLAGVAGRPAAWAQAGPQDNWVYEGKRLLGSFRGICVGRDDLVYVGTNNNNGTYDVLVLDRNLNYVRKLTGTNTPFGPICGMACDSQTNIYILEPSRIKKFDAQGNSVLAWGSQGAADGEFQAAYGFDNNGFQIGASALAVDSTDALLVADDLNKRVVVFNSSGVFMRKWGTPGALTGTLGLMSSPGSGFSTQDRFKNIAVLPGQGIATWVQRGSSLGPQYQLFDTTGVLISSDSGSGLGEIKAATPDGLLLGEGGYLGAEYLSLHSANGKAIGYYSFGADVEYIPGNNSLRYSTNSYPGIRALGFSMGRDGRIFCIINEALLRFERKYSTDRPLVAKAIPQPVLLSSAQRSGTTLIDIDFKVIDADSTNVSVGLLGFANGGTSLNDLVLMTNFVESTVTNLGSNVPANVTRRVTWNTATDWNVGIGNIQFEVLARDERGLHPFRFISIPTNAANPTPLQISDTPLTDKQQFHIWNWLLATQDPRVRFVTTNTFVEIPKIFVPGDLGGERGLFEARRSVFGTVGGYAQVQLAATPTRRLPFVNEPYNAFAYSFGDPSAAPDITLPAGRAFLLELLGVRNPTAAEVSRANAGRYGFPAAVTTNHVVKLLP